MLKGLKVAKAFTGMDVVCSILPVPCRLKAAAVSGEKSYATKAKIFIMDGAHTDVGEKEFYTLAAGEVTLREELCWNGDLHITGPMTLVAEMDNLETASCVLRYLVEL